MRRFLVRFSESEASNHTPSLADFTTTTPELKFSVHTGIADALDDHPDSCDRSVGQASFRADLSMSKLYTIRHGRCRRGWTVRSTEIFVTIVTRLALRTGGKLI